MRGKAEQHFLAALGRAEAQQPSSKRKVAFQLIHENDGDHVVFLRQHLQIGQLRQLGHVGVCNEI